MLADRMEVALKVKRVTEGRHEAQWDVPLDAHLHQGTGAPKLQRPGSLKEDAQVPQEDGHQRVVLRLRFELLSLVMGKILSWEEAVKSHERSLNFGVRGIGGMWPPEPTTDDLGWLGLPLRFLLDRQSGDWFHQTPPAPEAWQGHQGNDL